MLYKLYLSKSVKKKKKTGKLYLQRWMAHPEVQNLNLLFAIGKSVCASSDW